MMTLDHRCARLSLHDVFLLSLLRRNTITNPHLTRRFCFDVSVRIQYVSSLRNRPYGGIVTIALRSQEQRENKFFQWPSRSLSGFVLADRPVGT